MNFEQWYQSSLLRWKVERGQMQRKIISAQHLIDQMLALSGTPYVAFSGGKDSLVLLDLVIGLCPDIPVIWHDEQWIMPGTLELLEQVERRYDTKLLRVWERYADDEWYREFGSWPVLPLSLRNVDLAVDHWRELIEHYQFDGVFMGLRKDESVGRFYGLQKPLRLAKKDNLYHCSPLHDWTTKEVWAYIVGNDLLIHQAYRQMIDSGIAPDHARIGPLTAVRVYQYGILEVVKKLWPDLWNEFKLQNPVVL